MAEVRCGSCGSKIGALTDAKPSGNPVYDALMEKLDGIIGSYREKFESSLIEMLLHTLKDDAGPAKERPLG